jgi:hypothetical protein
MNFARLCLGLWLAWTALTGCAADAGLYTIVDGAARVLRGSVWYRLAPGAAFQDGDLIDAGERALVQVELTGGGTLHIVGPAALFAAALPWRNDKLDGPMEFALERGWLKVAAAPGAVTRVRTPSALVVIGEATVLTRHDGKAFELFTESGTARLAESTRMGRDSAAHDARPGEYWSRDGDKPFTTERRAPPKFVATIPRHLLDRLVTLAPKYKDKGKRAPLTVEREISLAEADPWLAGPYRRSFARRLGGRLADPAFRKAVETNIAVYPDFDRALHPEKYATPSGVAAPGAPPPPATASQGPAPAAAPKPAPPPVPAPRFGPRGALSGAVAVSTLSAPGT